MPITPEISCKGRLLLGHLQAEHVVGSFIQQLHG